MKTLTFKGSALLMLLALVPACGKQLVQFNEKDAAAQAANAAPTVNATLPVDGAKGAALDTAINATFSKEMDETSLTGTTFTVKQGSTDVTGAVTYAAANKVLSFAPGAALDSNRVYTATISTVAKDTKGLAVAADYVWSFTTTEDGDVNAAPRVIATTPLDDAVNVSTSRQSTAVFSKVMDPATINNATMTMMQGTTPVTGTVTLNGATNTATFAPNVALGFNRLYTMTVSSGVKDSAGIAMAAAFVWTFTSADAAVAPVVVATSPASDAVDVSVNKLITFTFSRTMDVPSVMSSFTLVQGVTNVPGSLVVNETTNTATFTPTLPLAYDLVYTAEVTTVAKSSAGIAMAIDYVWEFTTELTPDLVAPTITQTNPAHLGIGVALSANIKATFSEEMKVSTMVVANMKVKETLSSLAVTGTVAYDAQNSIATFTPDSVLKADTDYTVTITSATDLAGNALVAGLAQNPWTFRTVASDIIAPTITFTDPASGTTGVLVSTAIRATFSEAMDASTMISANIVVTQQGSLTPITGSVTYDVENKIVSFVPGNYLTSFTEYTIQVTNVTDLAGNVLVVPSLDVTIPNPWKFETGQTIPPPPLAINLRGIASFGIAARDGMTSTGVTVVNGDVALYPTPTCTDATGGPGVSSQSCLTKIYSSSTGLTVNGSIYYAGDPFDNGGTANSVSNDLNIAWVEGKNKVATLTVVGNELSSAIPYVPGIYNNPVLGMEQSGTATLDANGDANAVWIFQVDSSLVDSGTLGGPSQIILINGAQARNVWFIVGLDLTIGSGSTWNGNILTGRDATILDGSTVTGRVLGGASGAGAIVLTGAAGPSVTTINVPE